MNWSAPKRSVLVPFDFSMPARRALRAAREFAEDDARVHALYVAPLPTARHLPLGIRLSDLLRTSEKSLSAALAVETATQVQAAVEVGQPAATIVDYAKRLGIELIVIPTHGLAGAHRFDLGSVAERVVRLAPCPVLVLRSDDADEGPGAA